MSATITDYFNKASNMSGSYPAVATVTAARSTGGSTLSCDDLSSWATDTPVHFSTFKVNTDGTIDTSTQTDWKGIVNGNTITDMTRLAGAADSGNASGDRVELNPTIGWLDDLITGILVSHKQNGALKDNAVTESSIATGAVTNTKLGDGSVTSAKIGTGAISSYDKIGDDVIQARNIDESTFDNGTDANGWKICLLPSGKKMWMKKGSFTASLGGNGFGGGSLSAYPVGTNFDSVYIATSIVSSDNALILSAGGRSEDIKYSVHNAYGSSVTKAVAWSAVLIEI